MTKRITHNNINYTVKEFAEYIGITKRCLENRLECGWELDEIITGKREVLSVTSINSSLSKQAKRVRKKQAKAQSFV